MVNISSKRVISIKLNSSSNLPIFSYFMNNINQINHVRKIQISINIIFKFSKNIDEDPEISANGKYYCNFF